MAFSAIAAQLVAVIFNGTVYPLLLMMLAASIASLLFFLAGTREVGAKVVNSQS
jgi:DHA1 family bicyclomycin/chloramphenicol resistance-like MFS transporter